jgi:hypothetical protein
VLVHNPLNLVKDEGVEEAHTLRDRVEPDDNDMAAEANIGSPPAGSSA